MTSKKGISPNISKYYKIEKDGKITRTKKMCSRCGKGVFMSTHKNRHTCGKCSLTEFY